MHTRGRGSFIRIAHWNAFAHTFLGQVPSRTLPTGASSSSISKAMVFLRPLLTDWSTSFLHTLIPPLLLSSVPYHCGSHKAPEQGSEQNPGRCFVQTAAGPSTVRPFSRSISSLLLHRFGSCVLPVQWTGLSLQSAFRKHRQRGLWEPGSLTPRCSPALLSGAALVNHDLQLQPVQLQHRITENHCKLLQCFLSNFSGLSYILINSFHQIKQYVGGILPPF